MLDKSQLQPVPKGVTAEELAKFDRLAAEWWNPQGQFKHVHAFNEARLQAIEAALANKFACDLTVAEPFAGLRILDIGCGGGLLSEALARRGAEVIGIDGSGQSIAIARQHAEGAGVSVTYHHCLAEDLLSKGYPPFDVVLNTEVIEHVTDQQALIDVSCQLMHSNGLLIVATLNRTLKSFLFGIIGAEYVLRLLPRGTHDWRYFVTLDELSALLAPHNVEIRKIIGFTFNPFSKHWRLSRDAKVNYIALIESKHADGVAPPKTDL
ncbi:MAG: bifunctional 2-polyprenyl-6-hydroxyphenol methylase/3-demethylubiquinol 3-O-methyltransferase UbiG [Idiomarina sp.]|nr:bifunctional 2-polyprenyl-6-hydroxyphenol methylase/3-demethylubiquinol 3-O-methyltransferase UbiG [Idiomarina sp.]